MTNEAQKSPFFSPANNGTEFESLPDGFYQAVCVGVVMRQVTDKFHDNQLANKLVYIFQVAQGGICHYLKTALMTPSVGEKAKQSVLIMNWTGCTLEALANGFDPVCMIGQSASVVSQQELGRDGKMHPNLANVLRPQAQVAVTPDAIPAWLVKGAIDYRLAQGITVKEDTQAAAPVIDDRAPGLVVPQQRVVPQTQIPQMPVNAKVSQNQNPAGFFGMSPMQQACGTNVAPSECAVAPFPTAQEVSQTPASTPSAYVAPQPKQEPAPQQTWPAPQNPTVEVNPDDEGLPF